MDAERTTCWTIIHSAAAGDAAARGAFADRYLPAVRAYFRARWPNTAAAQDADDAAQDVFIECLKSGGALERADPSRDGGFRAFLYGVARNVAARHESRRARRREGQPPEGLLTDGLVASEQRLSQVFDRAWAKSIMAEAAQHHASRATSEGDEAQRRVELLRLRFGEGLPIRDIARRLSVPAEDLHRQYARARREFRESLMQVVAEREPGTTAEIERACAALLAMLE